MTILNNLSLQGSCLKNIVATKNIDEILLDAKSSSPQAFAVASRSRLKNPKKMAALESPSPSHRALPEFTVPTPPYLTTLAPSLPLQASTIHTRVFLSLPKSGLRQCSQAALLRLAVHSSSTAQAQLNDRVVQVSQFPMRRRCGLAPEFSCRL